MSHRKLAFYARCGVAEVWLIEPTTRDVEVFVLRGNEYVIAAADDAGLVRAPRFDLELTVVEGPKLRVTGQNGSTEI